MTAVGTCCYSPLRGELRHIRVTAYRGVGRQINHFLHVSVSGGNAVGSSVRIACAAAVAAVALVAGCTAQPETTPSAQPTEATPTDTPVVIAGPEPSPSPSASATVVPTSPTAVPTSASQPVPKVQRSDGATPTITAKPADTDSKVSYSDGVVLQIRAVSFGKETGKGPGAFPGREFAVLDLEIDNGSDRDLSLDTVVVTVLDKDGQPVNPVYAEEAKVADFVGELKAGKKVKAAYAFAVPKASRSKVTVVVDFDGVHTSAVFRGGLG